MTKHYGRNYIFNGFTLYELAEQEAKSEYLIEIALAKDLIEANKRVAELEAILEKAKSTSCCGTCETITRVLCPDEYY
jgi:hypothetical protein